MPSTPPPPLSPLFPYTTLFRSLVLPAVLDHFWIVLATRIVLVCLPALSFDLLWGYSGIMSFGQALFYGTAAYSAALLARDAGVTSDRKSTRLNSSHLGISYAVYSAAPAISPLSLHDALPISRPARRAGPLLDRAGHAHRAGVPARPQLRPALGVLRHHELRPGPLLWDGGVQRGIAGPRRRGDVRSEEHTSELQSLRHLVCRLLRRPRYLPSFPTRRSSDLSSCPPCWTTSGSCWPRASCWCACPPSASTCSGGTPAS